MVQSLGCPPCGPYWPEINPHFNESTFNNTDMSSFSWNFSPERRKSLNLVHCQKSIEQSDILSVRRASSFLASQKNRLALTLESLIRSFDILRGGLPLDIYVKPARMYCNLFSLLAFIVINQKSTFEKEKCQRTRLIVFPCKRNLTMYY